MCIFNFDLTSKRVFLFGFLNRKLEDTVEQETQDGDEDAEAEGGTPDPDASTPLKKQRSGRKAGGANQWTNQAEEIRRIVRKKRRNRAFPPQTLVWAKLENRPWWPARVPIYNIYSSLFWCPT
jgi:hypothetical protein